MVIFVFGISHDFNFSPIFFFLSVFFGFSISTPPHLAVTLTDLFPGAVIPAHDYGVFKTALETATDFFSLQQVPSQAVKVIQFYETLLVRHGVMLVGPTGGGKSTVHNILTKALCLQRGFIKQVRFRGEKTGFRVKNLSS